MATQAHAYDVVWLLNVSCDGSLPPKPTLLNARRRTCTGSWEAAVANAGGKEVDNGHKVHGYIAHSQKRFFNDAVLLDAASCWRTKPLFRRCFNFELRHTIVELDLAP